MSEEAIKKAQEDQAAAWQRISDAKDAVDASRTEQTVQAHKDAWQSLDEADTRWHKEVRDHYSS